MSIEIKTIKNDCFEMRYFQFGTGEKTAVILPGLSLISVMQSAPGVASAYRQMQEEYTVYVFDRRENIPETYTIEEMGRDTAEAFDTLGIKNAYVFGASQGGMIAQSIALKRPELVKKLALCSTVAKMTEENSAILRRWVELALQKNLPALSKSILENVYSEAFVERYGSVLSEYFCGATENDLERFAILAKGCEGFDVSASLSSLASPAFVAGSTKDRIFQIGDFLLLAEKTNARLLVYGDYSHALYDEAPDFLEKLLRFFAENG